MLKIARSFLAVVAAYAVMVILITLAQEGLFGGVSLQESAPAELFGAGLLTFLSAVAGGFLVAFLAGRAYRAHGLIMSALVVVETTTLVLTHRLPGPLWFDLLASASLIVGIVAGAELFRWFRERPEATTTTS
ncbi:MAG: hypothetical protein SX243_06985 [Acidobacteriota bacterium]|nr:hypothetical protein [Acidobacteriota bacterium]